MANRKRSKPRAMAGKKQERPTRDNRGTLTDRPMKKLKSVAALMRLYEEMVGERFHMIQRQAAIKAGVPKCGREWLVERIIDRYGEEIADMNRRISMLEVKLERMGVRI